MASAAARAVFLLALIAVTACFGANAVKYNLIFFGESLTDTGNDLAVAGVPNPKIYYKGRFSNGPIWVDKLRRTVEKKAAVQVHNYAYGGATACANAQLQAAFPFVKNLTAQVAAFAADVRGKKVKLTNGKTLALQFIGSDDLMHYVLSLVAANATSAPQAALDSVVSAIVACRVQGAAALAAVPGITDIAILPLAPIYISPGVPDSLKPQISAAQSTAASAITTAMAALNASLAAAGSPVKIYVLGDSTWIANGAKKVDPPFQYFDTPCFWNSGFLLTNTTGVKPCKDPENYLFYDQLHPTTRFHEWFANKGVLPRLQSLGLLP